MKAITWMKSVYACNEAQAWVVVQVNDLRAVLDERAALLKALRVLATATAEKPDYGQLRKWLDEREIYNGDLSSCYCPFGNPLLNAVVEQAIARAEGKQP